MPKHSEKLIKNLKASFYFADKAISPLVCYRIQQDTGISYTSEQAVKMRAANDNITSARKLVKEVYAEILGKLVVEENT